MADLQTGTLLHQRFTVAKVLSKGGIVTTYAAYDDRLKINVVINEYFPEVWCSRSFDGKNLLPASEENDRSYQDGLDYFLSKAEFLFKLSGHPNIPAIVDLFQENGTAYYAIEAFNGTSLKNGLNARREPMAEAEIVYIASKVLDALEYIHARDIIHGDICTDNIYITQGKEIKLIGFSEAINLKARNTMFSVLHPRYAPPEQYRSSGNIGPWTDLYAVGAVIYEAATLRKVPEFTDRIAHDTLIPPSRINPQITKKLDKIIIKALRLNEKKRFRTALAFRKELS